MKQQNGLLDGWITDPDAGKSSRTYSLKRIYELQAEFLFDQYEPIKSNSEKAALNFLRRLEGWIGCFNDPSDQWSAYQSLRYFLFVGLSETDELYRCAVKNHLYPWLIDQFSLDLFSSDLSDDINNAVKSIWTCPVTDSLRINGLLHRTGLSSKELRPDWYSLRKLACEKKIAQYVKENGVTHLVLFEDFVGSGGQCSRALRYALSVFEGPIFFSPLVICAPGHEKIKLLSQESDKRLSYAPIVVLSSDCLITEVGSLGEPSSFNALREAFARGYKQLNVEHDGGAFGYKGVACLYSSYSNCPNNAPPVFHASSNTWLNPIFPRKQRV